MGLLYGDPRPQHTSAAAVIDNLEHHPEVTPEQLIDELDAVTSDNRDPMADRSIIRTAQGHIRDGNRAAARDALTRRRVYREEQARHTPSPDRPRALG